MDGGPGREGGAAEDLQKNMKAKYPNLCLDIILKIGGDAASAGRKR
jgi:hypothetical protein